MNQLDLLAWAPPRTVLVFPLAKRAGKVRRVAEVLACKRGPAAASYWKKTVDTLADQMKRAGLAATTINAELRSFHDAVQAELCRRSRQPHGQSGDAA